ncbi:glycine-rich domain-containing protein [Pseudotamlana agarivorans]|uniref:glycine-rich domain-containing protein n=1 Tax=Pseudotamlana agarivorans TaxID=481183 RepID=UPI00082D5031|nr:hypothetical protein [Tamlana agarivorans]
MKNVTLTKSILFIFFVLVAHIGLQAQAVHDITVSGTYTVPSSGVTSIKVEVWGAGGAGANTNNNNNRRGPGGGGAYASKTIAVSPNETFDVVVGAGGNGLSTAS